MGWPYILYNFFGHFWDFFEPQKIKPNSKEANEKPSSLQVFRHHARERKGEKEGERGGRGRGEEGKRRGGGEGDEREEEREGNTRVRGIAEREVERRGRGEEGEEKGKL